MINAHQPISMPQESKKWIKAFSRPHTIQRISFLWVYFTTGALQDPRIRMNEMLILPSEGKYDYYLREDEWFGCLRTLADFLMVQRPETIEDEFDRTLVRYEEAAEKLAGKDLTQWGNEQLAQWFEEYSRAYAFFALYSFAPWSIDLILAPRLFEELGKMNAERAGDWYETICTATRPNRMFDQQVDLLRLSLDFNEKRLEEHVNKYFWIPIYNLGDKPWTAADFMRMQKEIENPENELREKLSFFSNRKQRLQNVLDELKPTKELLRLIEIVHLFTFIRDERVDRWRRVLFIIEPFYRELAHRFDLSLNQTINLLDEEITDLLRNGTVPDHLNKRTTMHAMICRNGEKQIFTNPADIARIRQEELEADADRNSDTLKGMGAYKGVARGIARVIRGPEDLGSIVQGEILVAHHTSPSYIVAMKRAVAFVTDEGGITSHAAIVSRELKIPCVTATRDGSSLIKTGDEVEVDADKGIVSILKRA